MRWWRDKFRVLRYAVQELDGALVGPTSPLWAWCVRPSSVLLNTRFRTRFDGLSPLFALCHHEYIGSVVHFAQQVIARVPMTKTR